jgi:hypothetical protein
LGGCFSGDYSISFSTTGAAIPIAVRLMQVTLDPSDNTKTKLIPVYTNFKFPPSLGGQSPTEKLTSVTPTHQLGLPPSAAHPRSGAQ